MDSSTEPTRTPGGHLGPRLGEDVGVSENTGDLILLLRVLYKGPLFSETPCCFCKRLLPMLFLNLRQLLLSLLLQLLLLLCCPCPCGCRGRGGGGGGSSRSI